MPRAGRRRSVVWACFVENAASGKRRVLCRFCQHDLVANPIRMVRHIVNHCPNADEQHKKICREYQALVVPLRRRGSNADAETETEAYAATDATDALHGEENASFTDHEQAAVSSFTSQSTLPTDGSSTMAMAFSLSHAEPPFPDSSPTPPHVVASLHGHRTTSVHLDAVHASEEDLPAPMDATRVERAHEALALALATTDGPPLRVLEHPLFATALQLMNVPALTSTDIETRVLPRLTARLRADADATLRVATAITVQLTSLPYMDRASLNVFASDQDHRQVSLGSVVAVDDDNGDRDLMARQVYSRLRELPRKPSCPLYICTDAFSASPSVAVAAAVSSSAFAAMEAHVDAQALPSPVWVTGCLMQASLSLLANIVAVVPRLQRAVDACALLSAHLTANETLASHLHSQSNGTSEIDTPRLDDATPWSLLAVVDHVLRHRAIVQADPSRVMLPLVADEQFWCDAATAQALLRPFGFLVALSDSGPVHASMVLVAWLLVWATALHSSNLSEDEKQAIQAAVLAHIQRYGRPLALVCLALDPRCRGLALSALGKRKVRAMVMATAQLLNPVEDHAALLAHVVQYLNGERPFDDEASWQMMASLPRLFWVEYMAEAPQLAGVALAALSFRPSIHSFQQTWALALDVRPTETQTPTHTQTEALKNAVLGLNLMDRTQSNDRRKHALAAAARVLLGDASVSPVSSERFSEIRCTVVDGDGDDRAATVPSYADMLPSVESPPHALWARLARARALFVSQDDNTVTSGTGSHQDDQEDQNDADGTAAAAEAAWFTVGTGDAVRQLQTCLQRALFGELPAELGVHASTVAAVGGGGDDEHEHENDSASAMLSGLVGLDGPMS